MASGTKKGPIAADEPQDEVKNTALISTAAASDSAMTAYAGEGFEDVGVEETLIPMIGVLQKLSPQVDKDADSYVEGAEAGQIFNTGTGERFDGKVGIRIIPIHRDHKYVEWIPRDSGGGLVGQYEPDAQTVLQAKKDAGDEAGFGKLKVGDNDLVETFYLFALQIDDSGMTTPVVIPFSSTQIKQYKRLMTMAKSRKGRRPEDGTFFQLPLFSHVYRMTTGLQENKKGKWHGWAVQYDGGNAGAAKLPDNDPLFIEAKALRDQIVKGVVKADVSTHHQDDAGAAGDGALGEDDTF